jgi:hypothetical protein
MTTVRCAPVLVLKSSFWEETWGLDPAGPGHPGSPKRLGLAILLAQTVRFPYGAVT